MTHRHWLRSLMAGSVVVLLGMLIGFVDHLFGNAWAVEPIKVGILY
jgi:hypothetical protein